MAFIAATEVVIIRDNPVIINGSDPTPNMNVMGTCVVVTIGWVPICSHECFIREWLRETLCAFALVNAVRNQARVRVFTAGASADARNGLMPER
jgi:hypothetical protein